MADLVWIVAILPGFLLLNEGAKLVTDTASVLARRTGRSKFVIGVLLVSTLGALPEVLVGILALVRDNPDLAIGSVLGSHILNVAFMIGLPAAFIPLVVRPQILSRDMTFLTVITFISGALLIDGDLTVPEGLVLILLFIPYAVALLSTSRVAPPKDRRLLEEQPLIELELIGQLFRRQIRVRGGFHWLLLGLTGLFIGADLIARGAEELAILAGLSQFFIGITVVSLGTSLPDIAAAVQAVRRGHPDLALAIGLGASVFTLLLTLGLMGILFPQGYAFDDLFVTIVVMTLQVLFLLWFASTGRQVTRGEGLVLFAFYPVYVLLEYLKQFSSA